MKIGNRGIGACIPTSKNASGVHRCIACQVVKSKNYTNPKKGKDNYEKRYFDDLNENAAFERCNDVLAEFIEKYAGRLSLCDIGYEYWAVCYESPIVTLPFSFEDCAIRVCLSSTECYFFIPSLIIRFILPSSVSVAVSE